MQSFNQISICREAGGLVVSEFTLWPESHGSECKKLATSIFNYQIYNKSLHCV